MFQLVHYTQHHIQQIEQLLHLQMVLNCLLNVSLNPYQNQYEYKPPHRLRLRKPFRPPYLSSVSKSFRALSSTSDFLTALAGFFAAFFLAGLSFLPQPCSLSQSVGYSLPALAIRSACEVGTSTGSPSHSFPSGSL